MQTTFGGHLEEAIDLMHIAIRYNPIRPPLHEYYLARALAWTGRFEEALPIAKSCIGRTPSFWPCIMVLVVVLAHPGRITEAAAALADWQRASGTSTLQDWWAHHVMLPSPEFDRVREGLRLAGLAEC